MPVDDLIELLSVIDLLLSWRFWSATAFGVAAGAGIYFLGGQTTVSMIAAVVIGILGFVFGAVWQVRHERQR